MATLTKAEAARQLRISRTTLYKLLDQGKVSATPDGLIDTAELVRVMSTLDVHSARPLTPLDTSPMDTATQGSEHRERPAQTSSEHEMWTSSERQLTSSYRDLVDILREQPQAAQERERDYREHIARLTAMLDPPFRTTHVSLSNFWVPIQSLCKGGDYATLVPPCHPAQAATVPHTGLRSLGSGRGHV